MWSEPGKNTQWGSPETDWSICLNLFSSWACLKEKCKHPGVWQSLLLFILGDRDDDAADATYSPLCNAACGLFSLYVSDVPDTRLLLVTSILSILVVTRGRWGAWLWIWLWRWYRCVEYITKWGVLEIFSETAWPSCFVVCSMVMLLSPKKFWSNYLSKYSSNMSHGSRQTVLS